LKILGYTVKDTTKRPLIPILKGNFKEVCRIIKNYDAVKAFPWFMIYRDLDKLIPTMNKLSRRITRKEFEMAMHEAKETGIIHFH
jgi:hypothetical protein